MLLLAEFRTGREARIGLGVGPAFCPDILAKRHPNSLELHQYRKMSVI